MRTAEQIERDLTIAEHDTAVLRALQKRIEERRLASHSARAKHLAAMREQHPEIMQGFDQAEALLTQFNMVEKMDKVLAACRRLEMAMLWDRARDLMELRSRSRINRWLRRVFKVKDNGFCSTQTCALLTEFSDAIANADKIFI